VPRKLLAAMLKPSAMRLAAPRMMITVAPRFAPATPDTTANVVTVPSIAP
jgi:hypothetical protein